MSNKRQWDKLSAPQPADVHIQAVASCTKSVNEEKSPVIVATEEKTPVNLATKITVQCTPKASNNSSNTIPVVDSEKKFKEGSINRTETKELNKELLDISPDHIELDPNSKKQNKQHHVRLECLKKNSPDNQIVNRKYKSSCNIEGIKSNIAYLHSLQLSKTALCLQVGTFKSTNLPNYSHQWEMLCHDTNDPLSGSQLSKGQAEVAILWPKEWNSQVKHLKMEKERVIAVTITSNVNICLINAYLPTQGPDSQFEHTECLDIIFDII